VNLISMSAGTVPRRWPPSANTTGHDGPNALTIGETWQSASGARGPYVFVFEFAHPAEIDSVGFQPIWDPGDVVNYAPHAAQSVRVETSTQGPDAGYSMVADYSLQAIAQEQDFALAHPATARWVRVTIQQRDTDFTVLSRVFAYGTLRPSAALHPVAGAWLFDENAGASDDKLFRKGGGLPATPDPALVFSTDTAGYAPGDGILHIVQQGADVRAALCHAAITSAAPEDSAAALARLRAIQGSYYGSQVGVALSFPDHGLPDGIVNAEGNLIVGPQDLLMRLPSGPDCAHITGPVGSGPRVLVLTDDGTFSVYPPPADTALYAGFRFAPLSITVLSPEALANSDAVVLGYICDLGKKIAPWQAQALIDFIKAGHKLIIHDADDCTSTDYSFLPYQFTTANPGALGARGDNLILAEPSALGTDVKDTPDYLDLESWYSDVNNEIGDANTVTSRDPHWCGHLFGTNALNRNGFMHMYARYGQGLIIYDGFDKHDAKEPTYDKLLLLELQLPVTAPLPCSESVAGEFLVAPSQRIAFVPGVATRIQVPLQVLANQGYAGKVSLATQAPADAPWPVALSVAQVTLKGNTAPLMLTVDVPATATAASHEFRITGTDAHRATASARITFVASTAAAADEAVAKRCTQQLILSTDALFAFNRATLSATAQKSLEALGPAIRQAGQHPMQINGYTDSVGSQDYNQVLSEQRATTVRDWLAAHGYVPAATPTQGFGKQHPIAPNTNPDGTDNRVGRSKNRRVEVLIDTCK